MKTLVLDLDETLIHSLSRHNSSILTKNKGVTLEIKVNNNSLPTLYRIYKRPYVDEFLNIVKHWFNLVCFTASIKEYADPVLDYLEAEVLSKDKTANSRTPRKKLFSQRFYRNACLFVDGKGYVKDLGVLVGQPVSRDVTGGSVSPDLAPLSSSGTLVNSPSSSSSSSSNTGSTGTPPSSDRCERSRSRSRSKTRNVTNDLSKVIIVDNSPVSYSFHKENGIMVEGWINDPDDMELMNLLPLLNSLRFTSDVRNVLSLKIGQSAFRE
ncbi:unnamed protein product [Ambrosiozyma monospora]|uniref:Unnamed protein product n=1 Tax=Ambrosiozyma monospora TaxID=43982 RepID=A0ACB5UAE9_AMBMO|nr:unnamed protein product [Ambrosiozyma monospora]